MTDPIPIPPPSPDPAVEPGWYYQLDGQSFGPFSESEFQKLVWDGTVWDGIQVQRGDGEGWKPYQDCRHPIPPKPPAPEQIEAEIAAAKRAETYRSERKRVLDLIRRAESLHLDLWLVRVDALALAWVLLSWSFFDGRWLGPPVFILFLSAAILPGFGMVAHQRSGGLFQLDLALTSSLLVLLHWGFSPVEWSRDVFTLGFMTAFTFLNISLVGLSAMAGQGNGSWVITGKLALWAAGLATLLTTLNLLTLVLPGTNEEFRLVCDGSLVLLGMGACTGFIWWVSGWLMR